MSLRSLRSFLALAPVLALLYLACGKMETPSSEGSSGGNAGEAGRAGGAGAGGSSGQGGTGKGGTTLQGGQAGQAGQAGASGQGATGGQENPPPLKWKEIGKIQEYPIFRLQNPASFRAFEWKPCDWTDVPGCEQASFNEHFLSWKPNIAVFVGAHDDGEKVRAILVTYRYDQQIAAFLEEDGAVVDAFFNDNIEFKLSIPDIWGRNYGIAAGMVKKARSGAILGNEDGTIQLMNWDNSGVLAGSLVAWVAMGTKRFAGEWQNYGLQSYSMKDGTQNRFVEILKLTPNGLGVLDITSAGDYFLYNLFDYNQPSQSSFPRTMISDGKNPGIQYTTPPSGASDGNIKFADSHVAWLRGFNQKDTNVFEKVELWASEFSPDPSQLKPYKVSDVTGGANTTSNWALHGGWGRLAYQEYDLGENGNFKNVRVRIFDLQSLKKRDIPLPMGERARYIRGLTRTHVWFMTDVYNNAPRQLYRWKIEDVPIVP
jgi:hypothetical protein